MKPKTAKNQKYGWLLGDKVGEIGGNIYGRYRVAAVGSPHASSTCSRFSRASRAKSSALVATTWSMPKSWVTKCRRPAHLHEASSSVIPNGGTIILPPQSNQIEHEAELVAVIGKRGRHIASFMTRRNISSVTPSATT
ncbi:MAG: fumarylacetoacetate hydrolase family protein [Anaerolineales bacterium]